MNTFIVISQTTVSDLDSIGENVDLIGVSTSIESAKQLIQDHFNRHYEDDDELDFTDFDAGTSNIVSIDFSYDLEEFGEDPANSGYIIYKQ